MLAYLYQRAMYAKSPTEREELLSVGTTKRRGRPRDEAAAKAKEEALQQAREAREARRSGKEAVKQQSADAHWAWIEACREYRAEVTQARTAIRIEQQHAREEVEAVRVKYKQTLDQLEATLLDLEEQGAPLPSKE